MQLASDTLPVQITMRSVFNVDALAGSLKKYALKNKSREEIYKLEKDALIEARKNKYQVKTRLNKQLVEI